MKLSISKLPLVFFLFLSCASAPKSELKSDVTSIKAPKLLLFISVDQMMYDYFNRFGHLFDSGLERLWKQGTVYTNAHHYHVPSNTAPGHATLSTGTHPSDHGVISNGFFDKSTLQGSYCVEDLSVKIEGVEDDGNLPGRSPKNLLVNALGDWLKAKNKKSKVCSISKKDRSAILMGGKNPDYALWVDELSARFVSSSYYNKKYPKWAKNFEITEVMQEFLDTGWHKKAPEEVYSLSREDDFEQEMGVFLPTFPHTIDRMAPGFPESRKNAVMLVSTPMADELLVKFAKVAVDEEKLGDDDHTDILFLGCSAADAIGHHFGPYSQEVQDYYLWIDGYLGDLFSYLDDKVGQSNYWVMLSADHGVAPFPEELTRRGIDSKRLLYNEVIPEINGIVQEVKNKFELRDTFLLDRSGGLYLKYDEVLSKGISIEEVNSDLCQRLEQLDYVASAFHSLQLQSSEPIEGIEHFRHSYHIERSPDILIKFKEHYLLHGRTGTTHGSVYAYDTHVPIILLGEPFEARKIDRRVNTVDIAPTLAHLLGIPIPGHVDGKVMSEFINQ